MALRTRSRLLLSALLAAGGGCDASVDPIVLSPVDVAGCPGPPASSPWAHAEVPDDQMIADFELGTGKLVHAGGRDGEWILGTDLTSTFFLAQPDKGCAARGQWSGHFVGWGFTNWGANWSAIFRAQAAGNKAVAFDGREYGGFSFWAAFGRDNAVPFQVPVGLATMDTAWNGMICTTCADHYMTKVSVTSNWQRFDVRFSDMKQGGWGIPQVGMRRDQMVGFVIWPRQAFDIWIDDLRLEP